MMTPLTAGFPQAWNALAGGLPGAHLLQSYEWGGLKAAYGWHPAFYRWAAHAPGEFTLEKHYPDEFTGTFEGETVGAAQLLVRSVRLGFLPMRLSVAYAPKGPLLDWQNSPLRDQALADLKQAGRRAGALMVKIDPDIRLGTGIPGDPDGETANPTGLAIQQHLSQTGWRFSPDQIQFRNTFLIDLSPAEETLLAAMKQKTRYNVRLAERKGVVVYPAGRTGSLLPTLDMLYQMYAETAHRDGFVIREGGYYRSLWSQFIHAGMLTPLVASVDGEPVAGLMLFMFGRTAYYLHGMSRDLHRERMPNYLLQWEAMRLAKANGCTTYDLWGAPDVFDESDRMWGVYRFKQGLGGTLTRTLGAWDYPLRPNLYTLYTRILPRILSLMRRRARANSAQLANTQAV